MGLFIFFCILFTIVLLHEAGHLVVAKIHGVRVKTFSIGFGWRIIGFKFCKGRSGKIHIAWKWFNFKPYNKQIWDWAKLTEYRIAPLFLGGFCAMDGENKSTGRDTDLIAKSYWQKVQIALAGVMINFITGFFALYSIIAYNIGYIKGFSATMEYIFFVIKAIIKGIGDCFIGKGEFLTMSQTANVMADLDLVSYLMIFGVFSIAIGILNLLPWPSLDGSLPLLWLIEKWSAKCKGIINKIIFIGFVCLMILQLIILFYWLR